MAVKFNNTLGQRFATQVWNAFNPDQQLSLPANDSSNVNRFVAGLPPDHALNNLTGDTRTMVRTPLGNIEVPEFFTPNVDDPIDQEPPTQQAIQAFVESGFGFNRFDSVESEFAYGCIALRAGVPFHQYDGKIAVISDNYEALIGRYEVQVRQIVTIYVNKCRGRFRKSFESAAMEGVLYAINTYDASKGRFSSWLIDCVHNFIKKRAPENLGVSHSMMNTYYAVRNVRNRFYREYGRDPEDDELRFLLAANERRFGTMISHERMVRQAYDGVPFDETYMGVSKSREVHAAIGNGEESHDRAKSAFEGARHLPELLRDVVQRFYFDADRPAIKRISEEEGVSHAAIGSRLNRAMKYMERLSPGIWKDFESIRHRYKSTDESRARTATIKRRSGAKARSTSTSRFVATVLKPDHSGISNFFSSTWYRDMLWDLTSQERRVLQYTIEGKTSADVARLEGGAITAEEVVVMFRAALGKLMAYKVKRDNPEVTKAEIKKAAKRVDAMVTLSEYLTDGESLTFLTDNPADFQLLLNMLTDKQRMAIELRLDGLSYRAIGVAMGGIAEQGASRHCQRGKKDLKRYGVQLQQDRKQEGATLSKEEAAIDSRDVARELIVDKLRLDDAEVTKAEIKKAAKRVDAMVTLSEYLTDGESLTFLTDKPADFQLLLSMLTDKQLQALELYLRGLSHAASGVEMGGIDETTVRDHRANGRRGLKKYFRIAKLLRARKQKVTAENVRGHDAKVALSNNLTGGRDPDYIYKRGDEFQLMLSFLTEKQRQVLELHLTGLSDAVVGVEIGGASVDAVFQRRTKAMKVIKKYSRVAGLLRDKKQKVTVENVRGHEAKVALSNYLTGDSDPHHIYDNGDEFQLILSLLTEKQQQVFELHLTGLSDIAIGVEMGGMHRNVVRGHRVKGMEELKRKLDEN